MNKEYIVVALSVGGRNNKIFKNGEKVKASNFHDGIAEQLVEGGFLKPVQEKKVEKKKAKAKK